MNKDWSKTTSGGQWCWANKTFLKSFNLNRTENCENIISESFEGQRLQPKAFCGKLLVFKNRYGQIHWNIFLTLAFSCASLQAFYFVYHVLISTGIFFHFSTRIPCFELWLCVWERACPTWNFQCNPLRENISASMARRFLGHRKDRNMHIEILKHFFSFSRVFRAFNLRLMQKWCQYGGCAWHFDSPSFINHVPGVRSSQM